MENRTPISHPPKNKFGEKLERGDGLMTSDCSSGFISISCISVRLEGNYEKLCSMESHLQLERFLPPAGLKPEC